MIRPDDKHDPMNLACANDLRDVLIWESERIGAVSQGLIKGGHCSVGSGPGQGGIEIMIRPGDRVRLKYNPKWRGIVLSVHDGHAVVMQPAGRLRWQTREETRFNLDLLELVPGQEEEMAA